MYDALDFHRLSKTRRLWETIRGFLTGHRAERLRLAAFRHVLERPDGRLLTDVGLDRATGERLIDAVPSARRQMGDRWQL